MESHVRHRKHGLHVLLLNLQTHSPSAQLHTDLDMVMNTVTLKRRKFIGRAWIIKHFVPGIQTPSLKLSILTWSQNSLVIWFFYHTTLHNSCSLSNLNNLSFQVDVCAFLFLVDCNVRHKLKFQVINRPIERTKLAAPGYWAATVEETSNKQFEFLLLSI